MINKTNKLYKHTLEQARDIVKSYGYEPLFEEYNGCKEKLKCSCHEHGVFYISLTKLVNNRKCRKCAIESNRVSIDKIFKRFSDRGYIPQFDKSFYKDSGQHLPYICSKHPELGIQYTSNGTLSRKDIRFCCKECKKENKRVDEKIIYDAFKELNLIPLFEPHEYKKQLQKLPFRCKKHSDEIQHITWNNLRCEPKFACKFCVSEHMSKIKKFPHISDEERIDRRSIFGYNQWVLSVYKKDNYICQCCNSRSNSKSTIHAHHIMSYVDNPDLRLDVDNGITLCAKCHYKFHGIYGNGENNSQQLNEFLSNNKKDVAK